MDKRTPSGGWRPRGPTRTKRPYSQAELRKLAFRELRRRATRRGVPVLGGLVLLSMLAGSLFGALGGAERGEPSAAPPPERTLEEVQPEETPPPQPDPGADADELPGADPDAPAAPDDPGDADQPADPPEQPAEPGESGADAEQPVELPEQPADDADVPAAPNDAGEQEWPVEFPELPELPDLSGLPELPEDLGNGDWLADLPELPDEPDEDDWDDDAEEDADEDWNEDDWDEDWNEDAEIPAAPDDFSDMSWLAELPVESLSFTSDSAARATDPQVATLVVLLTEPVARQSDGDETPAAESATEALPLPVSEDSEDPEDVTSAAGAPAWDVENEAAATESFLPEGSGEEEAEDFFASWTETSDAVESVDTSGGSGSVEPVETNSAETDDESGVTESYDTDNSEVSDGGSNSDD